MNQIQKRFARVSLDEGYVMEIFFDQDEQVYKKIKELHYGDNDVLVVSNGIVCFFNETFAQFSERLKIKEILSIKVISLQDTYNRSNSDINQFHSTAFEQLQNSYNLLQNEYRELDKKFKQSQNVVEKKKNLIENHAEELYSYKRQQNCSQKQQTNWNFNYNTKNNPELISDIEKNFN
ncbi:unnamed protein product [Paramecium sonneborni]|uniref:Uncharacterized protein n=1 Tax=Paramecium sonneborni TaxID=65129 RepID=A0A8S1RFK1_9CILI|nr:unnamed protein product [Paramecium sonneborni]